MFSVPERYRRTPSDTELTWYTLCVSSRLFQTGVYSFLDPYSVWVPAVKTLVCSGDDCFTDFEPLYPGYIFVGVPSDKKPSEVEKAARGYNSSFSLLRDMDTGYHSMTTADILAMVSNAMPEDKANKPLRVGSKVKIVSGPLTGTTGRVKENSRRKTKIQVRAFNKDLEMVIFKDHSIFAEPYAEN